MKQGLLAFQYEQEKGSMGMTGLSGLMTYVELMQAAGLRSSVERHVRLRERGQGWTDSQMIISLMLLNLAGGESVSDLDLLEKDRGLCRMLREFETCGMRLSERRALEKRWRVERRRSVPSESAVFRYLERFHDVDEESKREDHRAFIPAPNGAMKGLRKVNADLVGFVQSRSPQTEATLDMSRVPGSGVRGRGSGERETTASSLAGKQQAREKEDNGGQGKDGPAGAIAQGGNGR